MSTCEQLIRTLHEGAYDDIFKTLYAPDGNEAALLRAKDRAASVVESFGKRFSAAADVTLFSSPGRTEIGGNHTDHQHGHVLCGSVNLDMLCCAAPNGENVIRICSEGYPELTVSLDDLLPREEEQSTSAALVRGVAAKMAQMGVALQGFDASMTSDVLSGSGLSSSAAYEVLVANILNHYCSAGLDPIEMAKISQYAENIYFGKPCGLMDQMGAAVGGAVAIDFADPAAPVVEKINYDFSQCGHALCIIDTGSSHDDLTDDYAEITREMGAVAAHFGKQFLREVDEAAFYAAIPALRKSCGERAVLRAMHYYDDDRRAVAEAEALKAGDFTKFLALVNTSGLSSATNLQNIWSVGAPKHQAVSLALALGKKLLDGSGAIRVHGGGFAGTVQAFVPNEKLAAFKSGMEAVFGAGKCHVLHIRPVGGCMMIS